MSVATIIVYDHYKDLVKERRAQSRRVTLRTGRRILKRAQVNLLAYPIFDTGAMAGALVPGNPGNIFEREKGGMLMQVGIDLYYARFQEFGTVKQPARPFFIPAIEAESQSFFESMEKIFLPGEHGMKESESFEDVTGISGVTFGRARKREIPRQGRRGGRPTPVVPRSFNRAR